MMIVLPAMMVTLMLSYLFVVGGCQKLAEAGHFHQIVRDYELLPERLSAWLARILPPIEICAGLALLIPTLRQSALILIATLLASYSAAIALNIYRGRTDLDCGCAGPGQEQPLSNWLVGRNLVLIALALFASSAPQPALLGFPGWSLAFPGAALAALLYHAFNQLIANHNLLGRIARHG
jgi:uncharacterized membrane protein